jgi:hypothetical protein
MANKLEISRKKHTRSNLRYYPVFKWRNRRRTREISATKIGALAEIRTDHPFEYNPGTLSQEPAVSVRRS